MPKAGFRTETGTDDSLCPRRSFYEQVFGHSVLGCCRQVYAFVYREYRFSTEVKLEAMLIFLAKAEEVDDRLLRPVEVAPQVDVLGEVIVCCDIYFISVVVGCSNVTCDSATGIGVVVGRFNRINSAFAPALTVMRLPPSPQSSLVTKK